MPPWPDLAEGPSLLVPVDNYDSLYSLVGTQSAGI